MRHSEKAHCAWKGTASGKETYDEQPWRYIVATKNGPPEFQTVEAPLYEIENIQRDDLIPFATQGLSHYLRPCYLKPFMTHGKRR